MRNYMLLYLPLSSWILLPWKVHSAPFHALAFAGRSSRKRKTKQAKSGSGFGAAPVPAKQSSTPSYFPDSAEITKDLETFLLEEKECEGIGAEGGTEIGFRPQTLVRGLFATDDFQAGEFLLGVPFPACLTLSMDDIALGEPSDAELGLRMLRLLDEGTKSEFGPYFQSLPTLDANFDDTPDFWTLDQLRSLEFPPIIEKTMERKQVIQELSKTENVNPQQLQFATWLVKSRGFTLLKPMLKEPDPGSDQEPEGSIMSKTVMMPYVDMINHDSNKANAELVVLETKAEDESFHAVQATSPISKGQEITLCYGTGQETTADLLANYGFIPKGDNPYDVIYFKDWKDLDWRTTLEEDESALRALTAGDLDACSVTRKTLEFRIRMKLASGAN